MTFQTQQDILASVTPIVSNVCLCHQDRATFVLSKPKAPFKILGFTDLHLNELALEASLSLQCMVKTIMAEAPDLVVFVGDTLTNRYREKEVTLFTEIMEALGVYWTAVLGNHDGENPQSLTRRETVAALAKAPHCLIATEAVTSDGNRVYGDGNTEIRLVTEDQTLIQSLFLLDSGNRVTAEEASRHQISENSYAFLRPSQITWYRERVSALPTDTRSMLFFHIPLCEYHDAVKAANNGDAACLFGACREGICSCPYNSGLFDAVLQYGSTQAVIVGHDHVNDFFIDYRGVLLGYNHASGFASYTSMSTGRTRTPEQGATLYTVDHSGKLTLKDILYRDRFDFSAYIEQYYAERRYELV